MVLNLTNKTMNIWVEYTPSKRVGLDNNTNAQMKKSVKWEPPAAADVRVRYCQNMEEAQQLATNLFNDGHYVQIKTDRGL
jgi:hypothetical protein